MVAMTGIIDKLKENSALKTQLNRKSVKHFLVKYEKKDSYNIDWVNLCVDVKEYKAGIVGCWILYYLLQSNNYVGSHKDKLKSLLEILVRNDFKYLDYDLVFCGDEIEYLYAFNNKYSNAIKTLPLKFKSPLVLNFFIEYLLATSGNVHKISVEDIKIIAEAFNSLDIRDDIYESDFWNVLQYLRNVNAVKKVIIRIVEFIRYLYENERGLSLFSGDFILNPALLYSTKFNNQYCAGYDYYRLSLNLSINDLVCSDKIALVIIDSDTKVLSNKREDIVYIDFKGLCFSYKRIALNYIVSYISVSTLKKFTYIVEALEFLQNLRAKSQYDFMYVNNVEAVAIRQMICKKFKSGSLNTAISIVSSFFRFAINAGLLRSEMGFFEYLSLPYRIEGDSLPQVIPDDDMVKILECLYEKANNGNHNAYIVYALFALIYQTQFRIGQLIKLRINDIVSAFKPGEYIIRQNSKTSNGDKECNVITNRSYRIIQDVIDKTTDLRNRLVNPKDKDYVFLITGRWNKGAIISTTFYNKIIGEICEELGLPKYNSGNLRDTHMTKAMEYAISHSSVFNSRILTGHKTTDTTNKYYYDLEIKKMYEATQGVIIGDNVVNDAVAHIASEDIPNEIDYEVVEDGCGCCKHKQCIGNASLPCLLCDGFVTTTAHLKYFEKRINILDEQIALLSGCRDRHGLEDLVVQKTLYAAYLVAITDRMHNKGGANNVK